MHRTIRLLPLAALVLVLGCDAVEKLPDIEPPNIDPSSWGLPKTASGLWELIEVAGSKLAINPTQNDPITAVARCADLVTGCYENGETTLDACVASARTCRTKEPWKEGEDCCPSACAAAFDAERKHGTEPVAALEKVFFTTPDCFPGVRAALGETP
ncbi:MAG: hypothetical protein WBV82_17430 [Myxococcaceae bacterium]